MTDQKLLAIDIEPKADPSVVEGAQKPADNAEKAVWARSDNSFAFNFVPEGSSAPKEDRTSSDGDAPPVTSTTGPTEPTGQDSGFAFNFQIPSVSAEDTRTETVSPSAAVPDGQRCAQEEQPSSTQDRPTSEPLVPSKPKKKKKSAKKRSPENTEAAPKASSTTAAEEESRGDDATALTAEQQLNRELDWCIEQLEQGMRTQKGTPKQKEEASRALKTLRSSKAPLAKKRQVMRAMAGDYRKKMGEDHNKQFRLIQTAVTSAQVKPVSDSPKKSVFHRKAETKTQTETTEEKSQQETVPTPGQVPNTSTQEETFTFTASKEDFCFNFL